MKKVSFLWLAPTLTRLGKKFGFDAHYFAKNSALVTIGHAVSIVRGIITGYLVARLFEKETYGQYQFILSIIGVVSIIDLSGMPQSVIRAWAKGQAFSLSAITKAQLKASIFGSLAILACIPFLQYYHRESLWPLFIAAAILFPLPSIATVRFGAYTIGKARFDIALKAGIVWSTISILATLSILIFHQSALLILIANLSIPSLVYLYYGRGLVPQKEDGTTNTKAIIRYAWQLTFADLPVDMVWYIDRLLISQFLGLKQLAIFSIATLIPEQAKILVKQFLPIVFSKQARGEDSLERRRQLIKVVLGGMGIFAIGIVLYIVACPFFIPWLFPKYEASELIFLSSIFAITIITNPGSLFAQYLEAQGMIREVRLANWIPAGAFGVALFALIPPYGLLGAVLARGVFRFVYLGTSWWFILRAPIGKKTT